MSAAKIASLRALDSADLLEVLDYLKSERDYLEKSVSQGALRARFLGAEFVLVRSSDIDELFDVLRCVIDEKRERANMAASSAALSKGEDSVCRIAP